MPNALEPLNIEVPISLQLSDDIEWDFDKGQQSKSANFRQLTLRKNQLRKSLSSKMHLAIAKKGFVQPRKGERCRIFDVTDPGKRAFGGELAKSKPVFQLFAEINGDEQKAVRFA